MQVNFWLAQALSVIAIIIIVISFQIKNKNILLILNAIAHIFICGSLLLLNAYLGAAVTAIAVIRGFLFLNMEKRPKWYKFSVLIFIYSLLIISTIFTYENFLNVIMLFAVLVLTFGLWQKNTVFIRLSTIVTSLVFIIYNIIYKAYVTTALESLIIISCIVFLIRIHIEKKKITKD